jgi:hypothetical protein
MAWERFTLTIPSMEGQSACDFYGPRLLPGRATGSRPSRRMAERPGKLIGYRRSYECAESIDFKSACVLARRVCEFNRSTQHLFAVYWYVQLRERSAEVRHALVTGCITSQNAEDGVFVGVEGYRAAVGLEITLQHFEVGVGAFAGDETAAASIGLSRHRSRPAVCRVCRGRRTSDVRSRRSGLARQYTHDATCLQTDTNHVRKTSI